MRSWCAAGGWSGGQERLGGVGDPAEERHGAGGVRGIKEVGVSRCYKRVWVSRLVSMSEDVESFEGGRQGENGSQVGYSTSVKDLLSSTSVSEYNPN
jgi:hypothetical protein